MNTFQEGTVSGVPRHIRCNVERTVWSVVYSTPHYGIQCTEYTTEHRYSITEYSVKHLVQSTAYGVYPKVYPRTLPLVRLGFSRPLPIKHASPNLFFPLLCIDHCAFAERTIHISVITTQDSRNYIHINNSRTTKI